MPVEDLKPYRFQKGNPGGGHTKKHPEGYLTSILKNLLSKKIEIDDEKITKILGSEPKTKIEIRNIIMLRYAVNAMGGDNTAIAGILERIDGKVRDRIEHSMDDATKNLLTKALNRLDK